MNPNCGNGLAERLAFAKPILNLTDSGRGLRLAVIDIKAVESYIDRYEKNRPVNSHISPLLFK
jgi:hypothetical protein